MKTRKIIAEMLDSYLSVLTYLSLNDILDMPVWLLKELLKERMQKLSKTGGSLLDIGSQLANVFGGQRHGR